MARSLGFIVGIAVAAAIILGAYKSSYRLDIASGEEPQSSPETSATADRLPAAPAAVVADQSDETIEPQPSESGPESPASDDDVGAAETAAVDVRLESPEVEDAVDVDTDTLAANDRPPASDHRDEVDSTERQWHGFWRPFRSEWSASGFRRRLEQVTSLDYRVVEVDGGQYEVMFAFDEDADRLRSLAEIEAATGLALSAAAF